MPNYENTRAYARFMDDGDPLKTFRNEFCFPEKEGKPLMYFCGNSLGLQPKKAGKAVRNVMNAWAEHAVSAHFKPPDAWFAFQEKLTSPQAELVGALPDEIATMNALTVNLHLLLITFYKPRGRRVKILYEARAFPSDIYALASHARLHGLEVQDVLEEMPVRKGEHCIRMDDIAQRIEELGDALALVLFGGVNYYTGQVFDMQSITEAAHRVGAVAGFDLAHAAGNIRLNLHEWNVDFASWCTYKYLNAGPGSVAGIYIHNKHCSDTSLLRLAGWCGHDKERRFLMEPDFKPIPTAEGWQISNNNILSMVILKESLDIFFRAGLERLFQKRELLTGYLEFIIRETAHSLSVKLEIITPADQKQRGAQISFIAHDFGRELYELLMAEGVVLDWREPDIIRLAPAPLYNSFEDVYRFGQVLRKSISLINKK